jgi:hypothetical protein
VLSVSTLGPRRRYPVFWWWLAASYALWEIIWEVLTPPRRVTCVGPPILHPVGPVRRTAAEVAEVAAGVLYLAGPFLLAMIALFVARRDNARVHLPPPTPLRSRSQGRGPCPSPAQLPAGPDPGPPA